MEIVFTTFNARYSHTALALRCLRANLGALHERSEIIEFDNRISPQAAAEKLLARDPEILLFSVYIWNRVITYETILIIKQIRPGLKIVIGGPEVSYEQEESLTLRLIDHLICGEAESIIESLCADLLAGTPCPGILHAPATDLETVVLPYDEYTDEDIAHRRIYVETSRGCPSKCQYCLSALETGIRFFPAEKLYPMFEKLIARGARIFKLIDRTFNADPVHAAEVLRFFLDRRCDGMMLHLEWEPHLLQDNLKKLLEEAPQGFIQLETGVQTFTPDVAARIDRRLVEKTVEKNIHILSSLPAVHLHADLIAGLPGETMQSLAAGFDRLHACGPQEIQLGILKKLHGAPIAQHDQKWGMVYNTAPPYDVLQTATLSFPELQSIRRFARFWDITVNNGRFPNSAPLIWQDQPSVFGAFMQWSDWLYKQTHATAGFTPARLGRLLSAFLTKKRKQSEAAVSSAIEKDFAAITAKTKGMERQSRRRELS